MRRTLLLVETKSLQELYLEINNEWANVEIDTKGMQCSRLRKSELCSSQVFWFETRERA